MGAALRSSWQQGSGVPGLGRSAQLGWDSRSFKLLTCLVQVWDLNLLYCSEVFSTLASKRTRHSHHPNWLCSSCCFNKQATQPSLSFTSIFLTDLHALRARQGWQRPGVFPPHRARRQRLQPRAASIRSRSPQGRAKLQLTALVYFGIGFSPCRAQDRQYFE